MSLLKISKDELIKLLGSAKSKREVYEIAYGSPNPNGRSLNKIKDEILQITGKSLNSHITGSSDCPVCGKPTKKGAVTCGYSCANTYFRSGENNPNFQGNNYRTICFSHHKKECIICGESLVVEVHHYDGNHENNEIKNLIPLCPTHHKYMHSRHRYLIEDKVNEYYSNFGV